MIRLGHIVIKDQKYDVREVNPDFVEFCGEAPRCSVCREHLDEQDSDFEFRDHSIVCLNCDTSHQILEA